MNTTRRLASFAIALAVGLLLQRQALAGLAPENCLVVVNSESWASLTVANHFVKARQIPDCNIVCIPFKLARQDDTTDVETFREKLLKPVLTAIKDRGLEKQIDCIAWSSDFPTAIDFTADGKSNRGGAIGSINGLTFFYEQVLAKNAAAYSALNANAYYRLQKETGKDDKGKPIFDIEPPLAFSSQQAWTDDGKPAATGKKFMLSIVLGVTSGRGNSVNEVAACFTRSAAADNTHPKGTFYYSVNGNIRSTTRQWGFDSAIAKLKEIGANGEKNTDTFPQKKDDVMGAMLGLIFPKQEDSGSKTLPGAIVENLTSEGGIMRWAGGQTPLSDFIRHGAAGTSGTVTEPYAIQAKFPSPFLFYHYASGSSLAESFYQSIHGPYQLLIVGDPLCQPFAKAPKISGLASTIFPGKLDFSVTLDNGAADEYHLFLDGKFIQSSKTPNGTLAVPLSPGFHQLSAQAIAAGPLASRSRIVSTIGVDGRKDAARPPVTTPDRKVIFGKSIPLTLDIEGAAKIDVLHLGRQVTTLSAAKGKIDLDSRVLGLGPVRLIAVADIAGTKVMATPLNLEIVPNTPLPAVTVNLPEGQTFVDGPTLTSSKTTTAHIVHDMRRKPALQEAKIPAGADFKLEAYFDAPKQDLYQFQIFTDGKVTLSVDGAPVGDSIEKSWSFLPVALAKGKHRLEATGIAGPNRELTIRFGGPGSRDIGKSTRDTDAEHPALRFAHIGTPPPATAPATAPATQPEPAKK
jgi:uncharacterized protein (TIGR03790 family)